MRFEGRLFRHGKWWAIEVPLLGVVTQGRTKADAYEMVRDAIETLANTRGFKVAVFPGQRGHFEVGSTDQATLFKLLLQRQRLLSGLTLAQVSENLGLKSRNAYARYEQGRAVPSVQKMAELLRAVSRDNDFVLKRSA